MITITHYRRELGWVRHALAFVDVPYEPEKSGYYLGYDKPNYPMPAIRLEVDYLYRWPTNEAIACVMYDDTQACVAF